MTQPIESVPENESGKIGPTSRKWQQLPEEHTKKVKPDLKRTSELG